MEKLQGSCRGCRYYIVKEYHKRIDCQIYLTFRLDCICRTCIVRVMCERERECDEYLTQMNSIESMLYRRCIVRVMCKSDV